MVAGISGQGREGNPFEQSYEDLADLTHRGDHEQAEQSAENQSDDHLLSHRTPPD
jgi:hypothetical protein